MTFAEKTSVPVERSRAEIEKLVSAAGASRFSSGWDEHGNAIIVFRLHERFMRFALSFPPRNDKRFLTRHQQRGIIPTPAGVIDQRFAQEQRRRWRCLLLLIKAKIAAVSSEIVTFEQEFLSYTMLPDGSTVAERVTPMVAAAYETGQLPPLLALGKGSDS
jgi:hypothetical protein